MKRKSLYYFPVFWKNFNGGRREFFEEIQKKLIIKKCKKVVEKQGVAKNFFCGLKKLINKSDINYVILLHTLKFFQNIFKNFSFHLLTKR